jgi:hypothetical protein
MKHIKWTERKFIFGYSADYLNLFIERLKCTAPRIEELTKNISEEKCSFMPDGKWSIKQHIGHLTDLEELHDGRLNDFRAKLEILRAADMTNLKTEEADHNKISVTDLIKNFRSLRKRFIDHVLTFDEGELNQKSLHPRLQEQINPIDLLYFVAEHDLFHLEIISRIAETN